jgi:hypothetical protein
MVASDHKTNVPNPGLDDAQRTLPILEHSGSRVAIWQRWLNTEGVRLGLWVEPEQHQSSQDRFQKRLAQPSSTVTDGKSAGKGDRGGAEQPPRLSPESGVAENEVRGAQTK